MFPFFMSSRPGQDCTLPPLSHRASKMVTFLRGNEATLHIDESVQPLYFLEASNPQDGPTCVSDSEPYASGLPLTLPQDTVVEGVFVLTLARPKTVPRIEVELVRVLPRAR